MMNNKSRCLALALKRDFDFILLTIVYFTSVYSRGDNLSEFMIVHSTDITEGLQYKESWCSSKYTDRPIGAFFKFPKFAFNFFIFSLSSKFHQKYRIPSQMY